MLTLIPSYGRDYKSAKEVERDFRDGKDFTIATATSQWVGKQCSIQDLSGETVTLRYAKLTKAITVVVK